MNYITYCGNSIVKVRLPDDAEVLYAPPAPPGIPKRDVPAAIEKSFREPLGMEPLDKLVNSSSRVLIAFDDNCQPFPATPQPDIRQQALETVLPLLYACGVKKEKIQLVCAVALHRKMKKYEMAAMVGSKIMAEFWPDQLVNFDAEDPDKIVDLGETEEGEPVEVWKDAVESDLIIYLDSIQVPLNGGHKSVAVGLGTYRSIAPHHSPKMTAEVPHVMQPHGSNMHACIERISHVIQKKCRIMVMEAAMNNNTYPWHTRHLGLSPERCNIFQRVARATTPFSMSLLPEFARRKIMRSIKSDLLPTTINTGTIDDVHKHTIDAMKTAMNLEVPEQADILVFGLPDLSPYAVGARLNPVLVLSDVLGYIFNFFYNKPLVKKGGVVIILNPIYEVFHPEYHVSYERFYKEALAETSDPFELQERFQEKFALDEGLRDCYRNKFAHHGFHPFTVWYWATYALSYLGRTIAVGPKDDTGAKRLGIDWAPNFDTAIGQAKEIAGGGKVLALTMPPFFYGTVGNGKA
jgi:hypothetical protein